MCRNHIFSENRCIIYFLKEKISISAIMNTVQRSECLKMVLDDKVYSNQNNTQFCYEHRVEKVVILQR
jgi:hypothetical protein